MKRIYVFFLMTFIINQSKISNQNSPIKKEEKFAIIFIHGSGEVTPANIIKMMLYSIISNNKLKLLFKDITNLRFNKKLSLHQSICGNKKGLDLITDKNPNHYAYEYVFKFLKNKFSSLLKTKDIDYYAFNWSGCLSNELRNNETNYLYTELKALKKIDPDRNIIIIGFSHGGNIALNLNEIALKKKDTIFKIDLLILLATPIGKISEKNANGKFFSQIINFYSLKDYYQVSDIFFNFPRTKRSFNYAPHIINIDLRLEYFEIINNQSRFIYLQKTYIKKHTLYPYHKYFGLITINNTVTNKLPIFLTLLPDILEKIEKKHKLKNKNNYILKINLEDNLDIKIKYNN